MIAKDTRRPARRRCIIVSNRLPFSATVDEGGVRFGESTGGLVTGLNSFLESLGTTSSMPVTSYLWVGWPGCTVDASLRETVAARALKEHRSFPVYLSDEEMDEFYHGFCNKTIWPLFHYFPSYATYHERLWNRYVHVNERFCDALLSELREGDVVWIQDYHLMLLPQMLKARMPSVPIGFFLHIPFPSFEVYRLLPEEWRASMLNGLLGSDLIGFHTYEYSQHFTQSVLRLLGFEHQMGQISLPSRVVRVEAFPMGIDFHKFSNAVSDGKVLAERHAVRPSLQSRQVILSVDRLDYSKGILNRLVAFETLLEENEDFRGLVVLVMVVVPSRIRVDRYEQMKRQIEECVGRINGSYGDISWTPILYQYRQLSFESLTALYTLSDVMLVTPLRDGMNLVAKEYIASRSDQRGVLILSEMAGAAQELREAVIINPNNRRALSRAMKESLEMTPDEQRRRMEIMQNRLRRYDVLRWAHDFLGQLLAAQEAQARLNAKVLREPIKQRMIDDFVRSGRRLLLLDYDGTLSPYTRRPEHAVPKPAVLELLKQLAAIRNTRVVLISGRDRKTLDKWFGDIPISKVAEHGAWIRETGGTWKTLRQLASGWKAEILPILELYADRLPGASIEEKEFSLAWHYREADPEQSMALARQLADHLTTFTANIDIQVLHGNKVIEVRNAGFNKGAAALHWLSDAEQEFVIAIGDDWTDEDMFGVLPESAYSIRVGVTATRAKYNLHHSGDVIQLLERMASAATRAMDV